jgi:trichohyalin
MPKVIKSDEEVTGLTGDENEKGATKATKDGEEDIPKVQQDEKPQMVKTGKRKGVKDDETPLPEGFYDEDDEELVEENAEQRDHEGQARSSKEDEETDQRLKAQYQKRVESMIEYDEMTRGQREVTLKVNGADGKALAEGQAVGKAKAGSKEQVPGKPSTRRPKEVDHEDDDELSPIIQKRIDEEVEKRLKAQPSLTRRLFQDEIDEEDAKRQYEESMKQMRQASERMKKLKAEKDARMKKQFEERVTEELEKKRRDDAQKLQKKLWLDEYQKELIGFRV